MTAIILGTKTEYIANTILLCRSRYIQPTNRTVFDPSYIFTVRSYNTISRDRTMLRLNKIYQHQRVTTVSIFICKPRQDVAGGRYNAISLSHIHHYLLTFTKCEKRKINQLAIIPIVFVLIASSELNGESYILGPRTEYIRMYMI